MTKITHEIRFAKKLGEEKESLDEVLLYADGKCIFHLEQMSDQHWWMGLYHDEENVHINLTTKKAKIFGIAEENF